MTILEPILYANGALRLTRHGAGKGDTVLMHVPSGRQVDLDDSETDRAAEAIETMLRQREQASTIFEGVEWQHAHGVLGRPRGPGFYHG